MCISLSLSASLPVYIFKTTLYRFYSCPYLGISICPDWNLPYSTLGIALEMKWQKGPCYVYVENVPVTQ